MTRNMPPHQMRPKTAHRTHLDCKNTFFSLKNSRNLMQLIEKESSLILPASNQSPPKTKINKNQFPFTLFPYTCETDQRKKEPTNYE